MPPGEAFHQVFIIIPQADRNCPFLSNSIFWRYFFPEQKEGGGDYVEKIIRINEKITKINKGIGHKFW